MTWVAAGVTVACLTFSLRPTAAVPATFGFPDITKAAGAIGPGVVGGLVVVVGAFTGPTAAETREPFANPGLEAVTLTATSLPTSGVVGV